MSNVVNLCCSWRAMRRSPLRPDTKQYVGEISVSPVVLMTLAKGEWGNMRGKRALAASGLVLALYAMGAFNILSANAMRYLLQIFLYIALGQAWNLLSGYSGMTSLGQQLYVGLAGYAVAVVTSSYRGSVWMGLAAGAVVSVLAALALAPVLFRMHGMYFAIATWVAAEAVEKLFLNWKFTNQGSGMVVRLEPYPSTAQIYLMALTMCCLSMIAVRLVLRSRLGLGLMAMRDDPGAAAVAGVNLFWMRLTVYVLAALITGLVGGLFFVNKGSIYPDSGFSIGWTVSSVFICIIGGPGTLEGPVAGAVLYVLLREFLAHYPGWSNIMLGMITLLVIFFLPNGIVGTLQNRFPSMRFPKRRQSDV